MEKISDFLETDAMMLELSYLSILPLPVSLAIVGSVLVSVWVFLQSLLDLTPHTPPVLCYRESSLNDHVIAKCRIKARPFRPNWCLRSSHVQTILPIFLTRPYVTFDREYLQMVDKGVVALDWVMTPHAKVKRRTPVLLIIPSMTEGAVSVSCVCSQAISRGMKPVVFNRRGCGGSYLTTARLTSSGDPTDLRQAVIYIKQRLPKSPLVSIAYGSGCGLLMSYLGEYGSSALLSVAVCISPTFDEPARFSTNFRSPYDFLLLLRLKSILCRHLPAISSVVNVDNLHSSWTFDALNQSVFGPLCNASNADQYWELNNPMRDVDDVSTPVLCVTSLDDPINPCTDIPYNLFQCYPNFLLVTTDRGGHCGFLEGFQPQSWSDALALDYTEAVIDFTIKTPPRLDNSIARYRHHTISGHTNSFSSYYRHRNETGVYLPLRRGISEGSSVCTAITSYQRVNGAPVVSRHSSFSLRPKTQRSTL